VPDDLVKVMVTNVRIAVATGPGVEAGMVTLREEGPPNRSLSMVIGQPEARGIQAAWSGTTPARPSTWDLFVSALGVLGGRLDRAVVTDVEEERHFFATIELEHDDQRRVLSARPSDAIALALRVHGAEIFVAESVMAKVAVLPTTDHSN
jgi:uncharacterized protein